MNCARPASYPALLLGRDHPLRDPAFRRLAAADAVSTLGDNFAVLALLVLVYDRTHSAYATAGLLLANKVVPAFVAPVLTARVDRLPTRLALPALFGLEAAAYGALAVLAFHFSLAAVLVLVFLDGVLWITARGLLRAAVGASLGPRGQLREGNAVLNYSFAFGMAAGPALAGLLVAAANPAAALVVNAVTFVLGAVPLVTARTLSAATAEAHEGWLARLRGGIDHVRASPLLRTLIGAQGLAFVFFTIVLPIDVIYAKRSIHAGDAGYGALIAAWGVGVVVGSALYGRVHSRATWLVVSTSTLALGVAYLGYAAAPALAPACGAAVVGGVGNGVQWISVLTAVQEAVPDDLQARVTGLLLSVASAAPGLGYVLGGVLTAVWSPRVAFLVAGACVVVVAAELARRLRRA